MTNTETKMTNLSRNELTHLIAFALAKADLPFDGDSEKWAIPLAAEAVADALIAQDEHDKSSKHNHVVTRTHTQWSCSCGRSGVTLDSKTPDFSCKN